MSEGMPGHGFGGDECVLLPYNSEILPVHAAMLRTGKLLYFSGSGNNRRNFPRNSMAARLWDPVSGAIETVPVHRDQRDLFCAGHCFLPDGRLLVAGGTAGYSIFFPYGLWSGIRDTFLFDPDSARWLRGPRMREGRWYPTCLAMPDGTVLVFAGWRDHLPSKIVVPPFLLNNPRVERWIPAADPTGSGSGGGRWRDLRADRRMAYYPRVHVVPPGDVLKVGREPKTLALNVPARRWTHVADAEGGPRVQGTSVLLPLVPPDYDVRVLILGGTAREFLAGLATNSAEVLRRDGTRYEWTPAPPMTFPRLHVNATLLLDGRVLVTGGGRRDNTSPVYESELFDPETRTWLMGATCSVPRLYHSVAVLLPDGRVWTGGGNPRAGDEELRIELYTPGYCQTADRPVIDAWPAGIGYGSPFEVHVTCPAPIVHAALVRPTSVTHSFNVEQRWVGLEMLSATGVRLMLRAPPTPDLAPPGWYLLTVLDEHRCPASSRWIRLS